MMNGPDKSIGTLLANKGFDVYVGNNRGHKYSLGHTTLNTQGKDYWQFSYAEMGDYDDKAMVEYILKYSGSDQLTYIG